MEPLRIANCSGFYGDRRAAPRELLEGGPIDVLTGDYLAELTMLILWRSRGRDPAKGYATSFLAQMEECLGLAVDKGVKVVANAGGLNPAGLAAELRALAGAAGADRQRGSRRGRRPARPPRRAQGGGGAAGPPRHRDATGRGRGDAGHGQRLPGRLGHRGRAGGRRRRGRLRAGDRRLPGRRPGRLALRLGRRRLGPPGRGGGGRPRPGVRDPGHRRQLRLPATSCPTPGRPASRSPRWPPTAAPS